MTDIKKILLLILLMGPVLSFGQEDTTTLNYLKSGQLRNFGRNAMLQGDYNSATLYLSKFMQRNPTNATAALWLADSYYRTREYDLAFEWYDRAFKLSNETSPEASFQMAVLLKMAGKCQDAVTEFDRYKKLSKNDKNATENRRQMRMELAGCDSLVGVPAEKKVSVTRLDTSINLAHIEASPVYLNDSLILYTSLRTNETVYRTEGEPDSGPLRSFHLAQKKDGNWFYKGELAMDHLPGENISSAALSPDGKMLYFSKCLLNWKGKMECKIYSAERSGETFGAATELPKPVNMPGYTSTHPAPGVTSKDQKILYFVSDRKNGKGGTDIWYTVWDERRQVWKPVRNAGSKVNSKKDELSPWYDQEYRTLYYSSDGKPGIGGMDVYRSIGENSKFTVSENLREPINTGQDETFYRLSPDRKNALLASNRKGEDGRKNNSCCDDLYEVTRLEFVKLLLTGKVYDSDDSLSKVPLKKSLIRLQIVDPVTGEVTFLKNVPVDGDGMYSIPVEAGNIYRISGNAEGYLSGFVTVNTSSSSSSGEIVSNIPVAKSDRSFTLSNVYYKTDKHELTDESKTVLDTTLFILLQENPEIKIEISAHTDDVGTDAYNMSLSQRRAEGVVKYMVSKGIDPKRMVAKGYGETKPIVPNLKPDGSPDPEARQRNRRTDFKVIGTVPVKVDYDDY